MDNQTYYQLIPSRFGHAGLVWRRRSGKPPVVRIFLPKDIAAAEEDILLCFPGAQAGSCLATERLGLDMGQYLQGKPVEFALDDLDMGICSPFQREVLTRTWRVPRGTVITYGGLADMLNVSGAARAVGTALAHNPFALVIPCHRVVRSGGGLGGFGGGLNMKKALLEMEGVEFRASGKVAGCCIVG